MTVTSAEQFHALHRDGLLRLPNVWDAGSARLAQACGAAAIATTSGGVAWAQGYGDGERLPVSTHLDVISSICRAVQVPVTVDLEGGCSDDPQAVGELVASVIELGVAGINLEDGSSPPALLCAKIERARAAASRAGVALFVNARTDVYLRSLVPSQQRVAETLARAAQYRDAGADGLFVPGLCEETEIAAVVQGTPLPLNLMALAALPPAARLGALGVRRLSAGTMFAEAAFNELQRGIDRFLERTTTTRDTPLGYADLNRLMGDAPVG